MNRWRKVLIAVVVAFFLQIILFALYVDATNTTVVPQTNPAVKVAIVEEPYTISVVFSDPNFTEAVGPNCENYTDAVVEKVFGSDNPAVGGLEWCRVSPDGRVVYTFRIAKDFITEINGTLIQSPVPLAGKFAIKIIQSVRASINGTNILYVYQGGPTEFIGDHTPKVVYNKLVIFDPKKTFYVLPTDNGRVIFVFDKDFELSNVQVSGDVKKYMNNGYIYYVGKPRSATIVGKDVRAYFIYDKACYNVYRSNNGEIYVQRTKSDCNGAPTPATVYYDGSGTIVFVYEPPSKVKTELVILGILLAVAVGFGVYIKRNVEIKRE